MNLYHTLIMTCRDATYLHQKKKEGKLNFSERLGLKIHLLICGVCRLFFKQVDYIEDACKCEPQPRLLSADAKQKIEAALNEAKR